MMLQRGMRTAKYKRRDLTGPRMLDATALGLFDFDVVIVCNVILERSHLEDAISAKVANWNGKQLNLQIHVLEKFEMRQLRLLDSDV